MVDAAAEGCDVISPPEPPIFDKLAGTDIVTVGLTLSVTLRAVLAITALLLYAVGLTWVALWECKILCELIAVGWLWYDELVVEHELVEVE